MSTSVTADARAVRQRLGHPVIDCDGHSLEITPVLLDFVGDVGGPAIQRRFEALTAVDPVRRQQIVSRPLADRRDAWVDKSHFWFYPARNTYDRATAMLPSLLVERLDDIGFDFVVLYASDASFCLTIEEDDIRRASCRAVNLYHAELLQPHASRLCPVALIPMQTPEEALDELEVAVTQLGFKAVHLQQFAARPIPKLVREDTVLAGAVRRPDFFGLDSEYDYDPVWRRCCELGVAVSFHGAGTGGASVRPRGSVSNHVFNRVPGFSGVHERSAAALVLGGVTRRFPNLRFVFQEGGAEWACRLFRHLVGMWSKRNQVAIEDLDPATIDVELMLQLLDRYGDPRSIAARDRIAAAVQRERDMARPTEIDDFRACSAAAAADFLQLFADPIYVGCEGDDPSYRAAFDRASLPFGVTVNAVFGSDIGHFDVTDMSAVLTEAWEAVKDGVITDAQFRDFVFENPARLHAGVNPRFFSGTAVEADVARLMGEQR